MFIQSVNLICAPFLGLIWREVTNWRGPGPLESVPLKHHQHQLTIQHPTMELISSTCLLLFAHLLLFAAFVSTSADVSLSPNNQSSAFQADNNSLISTPSTIELNGTSNLPDGNRTLTANSNSSSQFGMFFCSLLFSPSELEHFALVPTAPTPSILITLHWQFPANPHLSVLISASIKTICALISSYLIRCLPISVPLDYPREIGNRI